MNDRSDATKKLSTAYLHAVYNAVSQQLNPGNVGVNNLNVGNELVDTGSGENENNQPAMPTIKLKIGKDFFFIYDYTEQRFVWYKEQASTNGFEMKRRLMAVFRDCRLDAHIDSNIFVVNAPKSDPLNHYVYLTRINHNNLVEAFRQSPILFEKFTNIYSYAVDKQVPDDLLKTLALADLPVQMPLDTSSVQAAINPDTDSLVSSYIKVGKHRRLFKLDENTQTFYYLCDEDEPVINNNKKKHSKEHCLRKFNLYLKNNVFKINPTTQQLYILKQHADFYRQSPVYAHYIKDAQRLKRKYTSSASIYSMYYARQNHNATQQDKQNPQIQFIFGIKRKIYFNYNEETQCFYYDKTFTPELTITKARYALLGILDSLALNINQNIFVADKINDCFYFTRKDYEKIIDELAPFPILLAKFNHILQRKSEDASAMTHELLRDYVQHADAPPTLGQSNRT